VSGSNGNTLRRIGKGTMKQSRLVILVILITLGVSAFGLLIVISGQKAIGAAENHEFPAFEMVYEDWGQNRGTNSSGGFVRVKLTYLDRFHWRSEILFDSTVPEISGSTSELSPDAFVHFNAQTNQVTSIPVSPDEPIYAVDDWLIPGKIAAQLDKYHATISPADSAGIVQMEYTEQIPCDPEISKCDTSIYQVMTRTKYWVDSQLPTEIIISRDGQIRRHVTVTEFKWLNENTQ